MIECTEIPNELAKVAQGRDHILTHEYAKAIGKASQTIRKNYCVDGEVYGLRPVKIGGRLLWSVKDIAALLKEGKK
jgi:hypothetical protein